MNNKLLSLGLNWRPSRFDGWWLSGGIAAANGIAAYQPKGAASLTASYTNLANPGIYDLSPITRAPTWDAATGWYLDGAISLDGALTANINGRNAWTYLIRLGPTAFAGSGSVVLSVVSNTGNAVAPAVVIQPKRGTTNRGYRNGSASLTVAGGAVAGDTTMAVANNKGYLAGSPETGTITLTELSANVLLIGCLANASPVWPTVTNTFAGYIKAVALYNTTLTPAQISALHTAVMAL